MAPPPTVTTAAPLNSIEETDLHTNSFASTEMNRATCTRMSSACTLEHTDRFAQIMQTIKSEGEKQKYSK